MSGAIDAVPRSDPDHFLAGDFSDIGCAIWVYFFGIWQRKPAIGLLTPVAGWSPTLSALTPKCYVNSELEDRPPGRK